MGNTQRQSDLARAALLRERVLGALRAAPGPMAIGELYTMSGIVEMYHKALIPQKVGQQVKALLKSGHITKIGFGQYAVSKKGAIAPAEPRERREPVQHLQLEVHKADKMVSFTFEGLQITVKVLP